MQSDAVNRDNWAERAEAAGVSLELLAVLTGKSYSAVYRYKTGTRTAPPEWLAKAAVVIASRDLSRTEGGAA